MAATGIVLGLFLRKACLLAAGLLLEIIVGLVLTGDDAGLIVRDLGLLALAVTLALDPTQFLRVTLTPLGQGALRLAQATAVAPLMKVWHWQKR